MTNTSLTPSALRAIDLHKAFTNPEGASIEVLKGLSIDVATGERLAIMGRSGGGKSTLLGCLAGLEAPSRGTIEVRGEDLYRMGDLARNEFRARTIGIIFQQFQLIDHFSALENVRLPLDLMALSRKDADERARSFLESVGLSHRLNHLPQQMSRGECQRTAIARVLAMGCPIIFADEPTGSLDLKTGEAVMDILFRAIAQVNATLILVTHDGELAKRCNRILELKEGRLNPLNSSAGVSPAGVQ